jgi:hypothetical protein
VYVMTEVEGSVVDPFRDAEIQQARLRALGEPRSDAPSRASPDIRN